MNREAKEAKERKKSPINTSLSASPPSKYQLPKRTPPTNTRAGANQRLGIIPQIAFFARDTKENFSFFALLMAQVGRRLGAGSHLLAIPAKGAFGNILCSNDIMIA